MAVQRDDLIEATIDLEVAVDDYTADQFRQSRMRPGSRPSAWGPWIAMRLRDAVIDASTGVAAAMTDADVTLVDATYAANVIPPVIREQAAAAEMGSLRALRAARARRAAQAARTYRYIERTQGRMAADAWDARQTR